MLMWGKQAFCGKGGYTTPLKTLWWKLGYRKKKKKKDKFLQKNAENISPGKESGFYLTHLLKNLHFSIIQL